MFVKDSIAGAITGSLLTAASILFYLEWDKSRKLNALKKKMREESLSVFEDNNSSNSNDLLLSSSSSRNHKLSNSTKGVFSSPSPSKDIANTGAEAYDESLIREQLSRNYAFLGEEV